ncbi:hypothetical protein FEF22_001540 [Texas Phoenix palm phytoplasma]|uniref:Uncharacterized protein n=1 Tax=Texas Phoenix palm phytoplasma TaxID=176709 RepID=A0ABS5BIP4_9MOLU|nr:hypothetical protein [Texas Phoenix palm phytoplasma]MBP3059460.1 hypothetical protein [Texas Phoenix palm phytoplasma]
MLVFFNKFYFKKRYFYFFIFLINVLILYFILNSFIERQIFSGINKIDFTNVFNKEKIVNFQINDISGKEETIAGIKSMLLGVLFFINFFGLKQGLIGISLGTFIGSCLGIWISMLFPSFIYLFELIFRYIFF